MMRWNSTKTYTEEDMIRMQQEAVNRVHEFQTRAREAAAYYDVPVSDIRDLPAPVESAAISADNTPIEAQSEIVPNQSPPHASDPLHGLLDGLNLDSETLLIIGLLFLLYNEHADNVLLLALAYLLL